ncbi:hypothetical protein B5C39_00385 [Mesomycoplasma hyopneumoniae]|nr:hypothetical protein B5C39_00385 [Mesomycoplasma hyopneumoniae]
MILITPLLLIFSTNLVGKVFFFFFFFKNYHVRRHKLHPNNKKDRAWEPNLKRVEGIHYLYGDPVKFPY